MRQLWIEIVVVKLQFGHKSSPFDVQTLFATKNVHIYTRGGQGVGPGISCASFETPTTPFYSIFKKQISEFCLISHSKAFFSPEKFKKFSENSLNLSKSKKNHCSRILKSLLKMNRKYRL